MYRICSPYGLGNRVNAMAAGLAFRKQPIEFVWVINKHCDVLPEVLFPRGVPGVTFVTLEEGDGRNHSTYIHNRPVHLWEACPDEETYLRVFRSLLPDDPVWRMEHPKEVLVCRFHRWIASPQALAAVATGPAQGSTPVMAPVPPMQDDYDRGGTIVDFARAWIPVVFAERLITPPNPVSSLVYPARATGARFVQPREARFQRT